jgi:ATP-dependent exoDNAse (exonuclease V) alpha subunit
MALFSMRMQVIKRSAGRSVVAAAAYRSAEKLLDQRQNIIHDYSRRGDVERTEMLLPNDAPNWVRATNREEFWNRVDAGEKRKDAQTARELRLMIPRELPREERIVIVRDYVAQCFTSKGMVADVCWHNKVASDGHEQPHAHIMLTMRPLTTDGFGPKVRHEWVPDPSGRTHPDGKPVMVESNLDSWNSATYYEDCRRAWEETANAALARVGSAERIDRRSLLERGLARMPEPALRLAFYLKELHGVMRERFGQFQMARHFRAVETRAKDAFRSLDVEPRSAAATSENGNPRVARRIEEPTHKAERWFAWFDRQLERLASAGPQRNLGLAPAAHETMGSRTNPATDVEH